MNRKGLTACQSLILPLKRSWIDQPNCSPCILHVKSYVMLQMDMMHLPIHIHRITNSKTNYVPAATRLIMFPLLQELTKFSKQLLAYYLFYKVLPTSESFSFVTYAFCSYIKLKRRKRCSCSSCPLLLWCHTRENRGIKLSLPEKKARLFSSILHAKSRNHCIKNLNMLPTGVEQASR